MIAALIVLGTIAVLASCALCWAMWDRLERQAQTHALEVAVADAKTARDDARFSAGLWRGIADRTVDVVVEQSEQIKTLAELLAERDRKAVVFAAPTLAEAVSL